MKPCFYCCFSCLPKELRTKSFSCCPFFKILHQKYKCTIESVDPLHTHCVCSVWQLRRWGECLLQPKRGRPGVCLVRSTRIWKPSCLERSSLIGRTPLGSSRSKVWTLEARYIWEELTIAVAFRILSVLFLLNFCAKLRLSCDCFRRIWQNWNHMMPSWWFPSTKGLCHLSSRDPM